MTNKIVILDDSVILYEHYISDDKWERTLAFPRGGLTYLLSNGTIKFYAYEDYFYRNCLISMQLPIYIVDEYMHIDGEYENIKDLTEVLDRIFPTNDMDAELNKYLKIVDAELLYQPIGDYALKSDIPDISDLVTTEELVEALDDYYTKEESDARFQPKGNYATKDELDLKADKDDVYTKTESDSKYQPKGNYALKSELPNMSLYQEKLIAGENITISGNVISSSGGGVEPVDAYTKAESDARFQPKGDYATESWVLGKNYITSASTVFNNYYTKTELNNKYYTKNEVNNIITNIQNQISALTEALNECCSGTPTPTVKYRWVEMTSASDFVCSGYDKYAKEKKQQSTDGGATWTDVTPAEYRQGSRLIENDSADCGYDSPLKFSGVLVNNRQVNVACNESSTLSSGETSTASKYKYIEIGECVSIIGEQALSSEWMTSITVPSNVRRIERMGFANCISASTITLSEGLEYIGEGAFENCDSVRTITIPDSVQTIYDFSFYLCSNLRTVVIGTGVTYIGDNAFSMDDAGGRNNIESVTIKATTPPDIQEVHETTGSTYTTTVFNGNYPIYVPAQSVNVYKTSTKWTGYASRIQAIPS